MPSEAFDLLKSFVAFLRRQGHVSNEQLEAIGQLQQQSKQPFLKLLARYPFEAPQAEKVWQWTLRLAEIDLLWRGQLLTPDQIQAIFQESLLPGASIVAFCLKKGWLDEKKTTAYLASLQRNDFNQLTHQRLYPGVMNLLPHKVMVRYQAIPVFLLGQTLIVAMVQPNHLLYLDDLARLTRHKIQAVPISQDTFQRLVQAVLYDLEVLPAEEAAPVVASEPLAAGPRAGREEAEVSEIETMDSSAILTVNRVLAMAIERDVSDIHLEPTPTETQVRFRKDGIMTQVLSLPAEKHPQITSRIKILSSLDVAEKRLPQDGRMRYESQGRTIDFRVSTALARYGETIVMRLIDRAKAAVPLEQLGIPPAEFAMLDRMLTSTKGLIFVTGPTGSGKTTTLYASLYQLANPSLKLISVEDPVEYDLAGIVQLPVYPKIGVTFAKLLRSILRQDPDIVMIGETRDKETAAIAIEAALTGHLVLTSLHSNDAVGTITRLVDMGIQPFLISSVMLGAIGQRLVRKVCQACRQPFTPSPELLAQLKMEHLAGSVTFYNPGSCPICEFSGYQGRIGIYEVLILNDKMREMIMQELPESAIREEGIRHAGLRPLQEQAADLLQSGQTTLEAVSAILLEVSDSPMIHCPGCQEKVSKDYAQCPFCAQVLQTKCPQCKETVDESWSACPACGCLLKGEQIFTTFKWKG